MTKKKLYLEILRILAIIFVIYNHTGENGYLLFRHYPMNTLPFWWNLFLSVFCTFAVPMFFAISGALLLGKEESLKTIWCRRIPRAAVPLAVLSVIYGMAAPMLEAGMRFSVRDFVFTLYSDTIWYHLWYLYAYLAFLAALPFLRSMVQSLKTEYFYYLIGLALIFAMLPVAEFLLKRPVSFNPYLKPAWVLSDIVLYPSIGYFLEHRVELRKAEKYLPLLWAVNAALIALCCYAAMVQGRREGGFEPGASEWFHHQFSFFNCMTIFLTVKAAASRVTLRGWSAGLVSSLGGCTFGIYLLHVLVKDLPISRQLRDVLVTAFPAGLGIWLFIGYVVLVCWALTAALRKIPVVNRIV